MKSVCVGSAGGRTGGRDSDRGFFVGRFRNTQSGPIGTLRRCREAAQSSRKRGVIEVVGKSLLVGLMHRAQTEALLAGNSSSGLKQISIPVAIGEAEAPAGLRASHKDC